MAQLFIKYKSQDYAELELDTSQEYIIGRDQEADIPLEGDKSLSREHSKLYYNQGQWFVKKISQAAEIFFNNESVEEQALSEDCVFVIADFSFTFTNQELDEGEVLESEKKENPKESEADLDKETDDKQADNFKEDLSTQTEALDQTTIIKNTLDAQLSIYKPGQKVPEHVKLTKASWVIGREKDCNSCINYKKLSRYHFEITKEAEAYWLTDLGSSNGTRLNGKKLKKNKSQELKHGDTISVKNLKVNFEIINKNFKNFQFTDSNDLQESSLVDTKNLQANFFGINKKYYIYFAIVLIAAMAVMFSFDKPQQTKKNEQLASKKKLKPGQLQLLEDHWRLAQTHYTGGKYRLCTAVLKQIHSSVQHYKNSKQLAQYCNQAYQLRVEQKEIKQKAEEKENLNNRIINIVEKCTLAFKDKSLSTQELNTCLYPATEIDPNHPAVANLKALIESEEVKKVELALKKTTNNKSKQAGVAKYQKALKLYKNKRWRLSIKAFAVFIDSSHYGVSNLKAKAKVKLKVAKNKFFSLVKSSLSSCKKFLKNKKYKKSAIACKKVLSIDPENKLAANLLDVSIKKSHRELKEIYKNSVFEESVGSVELAKKMWSDMIKKGIVGEEYYEKASRKLKKYEGF